MTPQQAEVADAIVAGVTRRDLPRFLGITREAVDGRLDHLRRDLHVRDYNELCKALRQQRPHAEHTIEQARLAPRRWCDI
jgi:DNA-binding CsgD family transcriptional regulator